MRECAANEQLQNNCKQSLRLEVTSFFMMSHHPLIHHSDQLFIKGPTNTVEVFDGEYTGICAMRKCKLGLTWLAHCFAGII